MTGKFRISFKHSSTMRLPINWGFVRDKDNHLYINNTVFDEDMAANS